MRLLIFISFLICIGCGEQHVDPCNELPTLDDSRPDILIIGDSISIGYAPYIQRRLSRYDVSHNTCNAMNSAHGVRNIGKWLSQRPQWDVITFNFGLWDAADWVNTSNEQYEENLRKIAKLVVVSTDKPMYILTTEVLPGTPHRLNSRVIELNLIAEQVMTELGIPVLDLYTYSTQFPHLHIEPTDVHFTERGYKKLGRRIVRELINIYGRF